MLARLFFQTLSLIHCNHVDDHQMIRKVKAEKFMTVSYMSTVDV